MKIGDEVYIHGYVDEIRNNTIIIRNSGGYFGTVPDEIVPSAQPERKAGKWVRITQGAMSEQYICPFCHRTVETYGVEELLSIRYPYCHCGADMRDER